MATSMISENSPGNSSVELKQEAGGVSRQERQKKREMHEEREEKKEVSVELRLHSSLSPEGLISRRACLAVSTETLQFPTNKVGRTSDIN
ncbi:hypothetical protein AOLI_G00081950 [Acnodon oligacanthus]